MKINLYSSLLVLSTLLGLFPAAYSQCGIRETANPGLTLTASSEGTNNRSGMVYNPQAQLYYAVNAGASTYPVDVYDEAGTLLASPVQGFDYRGAWWNPALNAFEGNGFSELGIFIQTLAAGTAYPTGTGTIAFTGNQPNSQSIGDLDYDDEEIIYFYEGFIHRYSRATNAFLGQYLVLNLPVSLDDINSNSVVYTGCPGHEIGLYDFTNKRLLFVDKSTGSYVGFCQLPDSAPARTSFGVSYAHDLLWLFASGTWSSYQVVGANTSINDDLAADIRLYPNPATEWLQLDVKTYRHRASIALYDAQGKVWLQQDIPQAGVHSISVAHLPAGLYVAHIRDGAAVVSRKITKR